MSDLPAKKDVWDRLTSLTAIFVPAAIALAGHFIAQGLKQAEIVNESQRAEQSRVIAEVNTKIAQANLINTLMKSLTSTVPQERKLAVQAVLMALPEQGLVFARTIAEMDEDEGVQESARHSIEMRLDSLAQDLFSEEKSTRIAAAQELAQTWRNDPSVVGAIVDVAKSQPTNADGVYNSAVVLGSMTPNALSKSSNQVDQFVELAGTAGPKTEARLQTLQKRRE